MKSKCVDIVNIYMLGYHCIEPKLPPIFRETSSIYFNGDNYLQLPCCSDSNENSISVIDNDKFMAIKIKSVIIYIHYCNRIINLESFFVFCKFSVSDRFNTVLLMSIIGHVLCNRKHYFKFD